MTEIGSLVILRPLWLLAIPAILVATWLLVRRSDGLARWHRVIAPELMAFLRQRGMVDPAVRSPRPLLLGAAALLLSVGLAGPASRKADAPVFRNLDVVVILMDLSPSVIAGGGLGDAQAAVSRLLDRHGTRPVALALYAGESFLVSVPSAETDNLQTTVGAIGPETMPVAGSRPDRALAEARRLLAGTGAERADVVIVTDGAGIGPDARHEADLLRAAGARLSAVIVTSPAPPYGMPSPDTAVIGKIVSAGSGLTVTARDPEPLLALLDERNDAAEADRARNSVLFQDQGRWAVLLAGVALLPLFRRRRAD